MIEQHSSLTEKFIRKGFWLYFFSFIIAPIGYLVKIIISHDLEVSDIGIIYGIISLITLISAYNDFGMSDSMNHFLPKFITEKRYDKVKTILFFSISIQMLTGISIFFIFLFGADFLANHYLKSPESKEIIKIFSLFFLGINIFEVLSNFFIAIQNTLYTKFLDLIRSLGLLISVLFLFLSDKGNIILYSYAWIIGLFIGILVGSYLFYTKYYRIYLKNEKIIWEYSFFKNIFLYASAIFIGSQASTLLSQVDMQMILYLLGTTQAGYYANYLSIISIPFMFLGPIFAFLFPLFSELHSKKESEKIILIKYTFNKYFISLAIAIFIFFFIFSKEIAYILFGEKFIMSGIILQYSIGFLLFNFLFQINFNIMAAIGKVKERVQIVSMVVIVNIITNYLLINSIGVTGAALATGIGWIFIWILSEYFVGKEFRSNFDKRFLLKNFLVFFLLGIFFFSIKGNYLILLARGTSLSVLFMVSCIYFCIFGILNYKEGSNIFKILKRHI